MTIPEFIYPLYVNEHLVYFQSGTILNKAAMNIRMFMSLVDIRAYFSCKEEILSGMSSSRLENGQLCLKANPGSCHKIQSLFMFQSAGILI